VEDDLASLALGTLAGRQRVAVLAHLESCAHCSAEVDELSKTADELLHLSPSAEPPVGFEAGVFEHGLQDRPRRWWPSFGRRHAYRPKLAAAIGAGAVALMALAFGLGALVGHGSGGKDSFNAVPIAPHAAVTEAALLTGTGTVGGGVMVYAGNPTWLFMFMDDPSWQGTLGCEVVLDQGPTVMLGRFWLSDGRGAWAVSIPQPAGRLAQARVVNDKGQVLAEAALS
jgi:hypothetical protein